MPDYTCADIDDFIFAVQALDDIRGDLELLYVDLSGEFIQVIGIQGSGHDITCEFLAELDVIDAVLGDISELDWMFNLSSEYQYSFLDRLDTVRNDLKTLYETLTGIIFPEINILESYQSAVEQFQTEITVCENLMEAIFDHFDKDHNLID